MAVFAILIDRAAAYNARLRVGRRLFEVLPGYGVDLTEEIFWKGRYGDGTISVVKSYSKW